jgi:putative phosphoesterase
LSDSYHILALADTHVDTLQHLPEKISQLAKEADCVVHCGDFIKMRVVDELRSLAKRFIGVYGNRDSAEVKGRLPTETTFEVWRKKIVVTHPYIGGPPWGLEEYLVAQYPDADVIIFGHTHDACSINKNGTLLFNPGQGYPIFILKASVGILKLTEEGVEGRVSSVDDAILF